jgi:hypothetical protein
MGFIPGQRGGGGGGGWSGWLSEPSRAAGRAKHGNPCFFLCPGARPNMLSHSVVESHAVDANAGRPYGDLPACEYVRLHA